MDEDWHAICRPFSKVSRDQSGKPCTTRMYRCTKRSNVRNREENKKASALWPLKEAKGTGIGVYDPGSVRKKKTRSQVRLDFWAIHWKNPTGCLARRAETHGSWSRTGSILCRRWKRIVNILFHRRRSIRISQLLVCMQTSDVSVCFP